ncbi:MAG: hypothetical protein R2844_14455 [Caldilineales bacterium]
MTRNWATWWRPAAPWALAGSYGGGTDVWHGQFDPHNGSRTRWSQLTAAQNQAVNGLAPLASGGYLLVGQTFQSGRSYELTVQEYDQAGLMIQEEVDGTTAYDTALAVATTGSAIVVGGTTTGALVPGQYAGNVDAWLRRYDSALDPVWTTQFGGGGNDSVEAIVTGAAGELYVAGTTAPDLDRSNAIIGRVNPATGAFVEQHVIPVDAAPGPGGMLVYYEATVAALAGDILYVGGNKTDANVGNVSFWLARLNVNNLGTPVWVRSFDSSSSEEIGGLAPDPLTRDIYFTGWTNGSLPGADGSGHIVVGALDQSGQQLLLQQMGTPQGDSASDIVMDGDGALYIAGTTNGDLDGGGPGTQHGQGDMFVMRLAPDRPPEPELVLEPLGPGWLVNGVPLSPGSQTVINPGDLIQLQCSLSGVAEDEPSCEDVEAARWAEKCDFTIRYLAAGAWNKLEWGDLEIATGVLRTLYWVLRGCGSPGPAESPAQVPAIALELVEGGYGFFTTGEPLSATIASPLVTASATGHHAFSVFHDPDESVGEVTSHVGQTRVVPAYPGLPAVTLQDGQVVALTATSIGSVTDLGRLYLPIIKR